MRLCKSLTLLISIGCASDRAPSGPPSTPGAPWVHPADEPSAYAAHDAGFVVEPATDGGSTSPFAYELALFPTRLIVRDAVDGEWVATFTYNARTVTLRGPERSFAEETAPHPVVHDKWVRVLDEPFDGVVDEAWLLDNCASTEPDVLEIAMQYVAGAPDVVVDGMRIAGDADYGPIVDGARQEGADFNDYLGIDWSYADDVDHNEAFQLGSLDCSGYLRMVWGYRSGVPMVGSEDGLGVALPRRAVQIAATGPGIVTIPEVIGVTPALDALEVGDLVFFDADEGDGTDIDHAGMYLGVDTSGRPRFLSSRKSINGPTLGDYNGASCLDGSGLYATTFRAARRL